MTAPSEMFRCDEYRVTLSRRACGKRYRQVNRRGKAPNGASVSPLAKCKGCALGRAHARGERPDVELGDVLALFENYQQWRSTKRMLLVVYALRGSGVPLSDPLMAVLHLWMRNERHNWDTEEGTRRRAINSRNEDYRLAARRLAERYGEIRIAAVDLRKFAKRANPEDKDALEQPQREQRQQAAPSEFIAALKLAASNVGADVVKVDATGASSTCHVCGGKCEPGAAETHACERCGAEWSTDENHCRNLLARGRESEALA